MAACASGLTVLQDRWKRLYQETLPQAAREKDLAQAHWPVRLDHCFARIILDNAVGKSRPWMSVVRSPAWRNMTEVQLKAAIDLGEAILHGKADLVELNRQSLKVRGKAGSESGGRPAERGAKTTQGKSRLSSRLSQGGSRQGRKR